MSPQQGRLCTCTHRQEAEAPYTPRAASRGTKRVILHHLGHVKLLVKLPEVTRTLATAVWQIFQMMSRSPHTIQAQPLSFTFTEIWSSAGRGSKDTVRYIYQDRLEMSQRENILSTFSHGQRLHNLDR